jgi:hypothetical protein
METGGGGRRPAMPRPTSRLLGGQLVHSGGVDRAVTASLQIGVSAPARVAVQVAVASPDVYRADETVDISLDGSEIGWGELNAGCGGRVWLIDSAPGVLRVDYRASLPGAGPPWPSRRATSCCGGTAPRPRQYLHGPEGGPAPRSSTGDGQQMTRKTRRTRRPTRSPWSSTAVTSKGVDGDTSHDPVFARRGRTDPARRPRLPFRQPSPRE